MASRPTSVKSANEDDRSANEDGQLGTEPLAFARRLKGRAEQKGTTRAQIVEALGIAKQTFGPYWNGERLPPSELLFRLSDILDCDPRWLSSGTPSRTSASALLDADSADWLSIPEYDLRLMSDHSLGEPTMHVPVRRDWLATNFRTTTGLWLTRLPADYHPINLTEGAMVLCRSIDATDLAEGNICIWRFHTNLVVGRFSVVPDAIPIRARQQSELPDVVIAPSQIDGAEDRFHLVGRVLGVFLRPL